MSEYYKLKRLSKQAMPRTGRVLDAGGFVGGVRGGSASGGGSGIVVPGHNELGGLVNSESYLRTDRYVHLTGEQLYELTNSVASRLSFVDGYLLYTADELGAEAVKVKAGFADEFPDIVETRKTFKAGAEVSNLEVTETATIKNAVVEDIQAKKTTSDDLIVKKLAEILNLNVAEVARIANTIVLDKIGSEDYASTMLGWVINKTGDGELRSLRLREFLEVPELRCNRATVITGEQWSAPGGGIIESVDTENCILYLKLEKKEIAALEIDDICKAIYNHDNGFQTIYFRITEKIGEASFKYVQRSGDTGHPSAFMHFVAYGNFTKKDRQNSAYTTHSYTRYLADVNNWEQTADMIMMQFGDLENLRLHGIDMTGYSAYLKNIYLTGTIKQISSDGVTETQIPCFKGEWGAGEYWYYDEITHNGASWLCISEKTTQEPNGNAPDWLETSAKGKDAVVVNVFSTNGNVFQNGQGCTKLYIVVIQGDKDITSGIPTNRTSWTRTSASVDADLIFNELHEGYGTELIITPEDVIGRATFDCIINL